MTKRVNEAKKVVTVRVNQESVRKLNEIARTQGVTVSSLINSTIEKFLRGEESGNGDNQVEMISSKDLETIVPVMKTFPKPVPLKMVLEIIRLQRQWENTN